MLYVGATPVEFTRCPCVSIHAPGLELDAEAALDYLLNRRDIDTSRIIVFGRSLGGAVAVSLASNTLYSDK